MIRHNEGMEVVIKATGYWVEWFNLGPRPEATIIGRCGPYETREQAEAQERKWRAEIFA